MAVEISQPFRVFTDVDGEPLEDGFIHIGAVNQNPQVVPISVFFDVALTIPAAQPIRTLGGYPSRTGTPSRLYVAEAEYSISVSNKNSTLIYSSLDSDNPLAETGSPSNGAALIARGDQIVNSITELRALLKTSASKFAFVNGYYAAGDGGGGQYYFDAADTTSLDNGGTIIVATDGGRWKLVHTSSVSINQFGAVGDGIANDQAAFDAAKAWALGRAPLTSEIIFLNKKYKITQSPNWCINHLKLTTIGRPEIICVGGASASALLMDGQAITPGGAFYGMSVGDFILTGNASTLAVFKTLNVSHSRFGRISAKEADPLLGAGFHIGWGVANIYEQIACSINQTPMTNKPLRGLFITHSAGLPTTDCTFIQYIMEGTTLGVQIAANGGEFNTFIGGTAEACTNTGFTIDPGNKGNRIINIACEANTTFDIVDQGTQTVIEGGYSTKLIQFSAAISPSLRDMRAQQITVSVDTVRAEVIRCYVSSFAAGGTLTDFSSTTIKEDIWNQNTSVFVIDPEYGSNPVKTLATITVGASPFTYTNTTNYTEQIIVRVGTPTQERLIRSGSPTIVGGGGTGLPTQNIFTLLPGDALEVTHTSLPEMIKIPI